MGYHMPNPSGHPCKWGSVPVGVQETCQRLGSCYIFLERRGMEQNRSGFLPGKSENMNNVYTLPENIPRFPRNDRGRGFLAFHPPSEYRVSVGKICVLGDIYREFPVFIWLRLRFHRQSCENSE